jgi:hypothetical protein
VGLLLPQSWHESAPVEPATQAPGHPRLARRPRLPPVLAGGLPGERMAEDGRPQCPDTVRGAVGAGGGRPGRPRGDRGVGGPEPLPGQSADLGRSLGLGRRDAPLVSPAGPGRLVPVPPALGPLGPRRERLGPHQSRRIIGRPQAGGGAAVDPRGDGPALRVPAGSCALGPAAPGRAAGVGAGGAALRATRPRPRRGRTIPCPHPARCVVEPVLAPSRRGRALLPPRRRGPGRPAASPGDRPFLGPAPLPVRAGRPGLRPL